MKIHSNLYYEDKTYDTETDMAAIQKLIDSVVANNKNTICSTGTVIKVRQAVKFNDGTYSPTGYFSSSEERKIILNRISNNLKGVTSNGNTIVINGKEFDYISKFDDIVTILDFLDLVEKCLVYELDAVSTNKNLPYEKRRLGEKHFLVGEEKELIEWAAKNRIWHWLRETKEEL